MLLAESLTTCQTPPWPLPVVASPAALVLTHFEHGYLK